MNTINTTSTSSELAAMKAQLDQYDDYKYSTSDDTDDTPEMEDLRLRYETLLAKSWIDENGLLTGAIPYILQTLAVDRSRFMIVNNLVDQYLHLRFERGEEHDFVEDRPQIGLFYTCRKGRSGLCQVSYQNAMGHYIEINQYQATISVTEGGTPYKVYRTFLNADGSTSYRLVREVVVIKHDDTNEVPAFLNYALVKADGRLFKLLDKREDFDEDAWQDMFMERALRDRRLPNFNDVPTSLEVAAWLTDYLGALDALAERGPDVTLEEITRVSVSAGDTFYALTSAVAFHYDPTTVGDEDNTDETDHALDDVDGSVVMPEVARF